MSNHPYYDTILLIERLHRNFLEGLKVQLERLGLRDINNIQALILYNIASDELTIGELTQRGYYLGSNVSYNIRKMVDNDYLKQVRSKHDRRSVRVSLSDKGNDLREKMIELFESQVEKLETSNISKEQLTQTNASLQNLEKFWSMYSDYTSQAFGGGYRYQTGF